MVNVITGPVLWEPPWKGPHSEATKASFCFFSSAFSLFIYLCLEGGEEADLSLYFCSPSMSLALSQTAWPHGWSPPALLTPQITAPSHYLKHIYCLCLTVSIWLLFHTSYQFVQVIENTEQEFKGNRETWHLQEWLTYSGYSSRLVKRTRQPLPQVPGIPYLSEEDIIPSWVTTWRVPSHSDASSHANPILISVTERPATDCLL